MDDRDEDNCTATNLSADDSAELRDIVGKVLASSGGEAATLSSRFSKLVTHYQEQPQLLDPILEALVHPLASLILQISQPLELFTTDLDAQSRVYSTSKLLWQVASVRGYKTVLRFLPNEVAAVEPAVALLSFLAADSRSSGQNGGVQGLKNWEAEYVMLMWLSLLAMIPFDLAIIDSSLTATSGGAAAAASSTSPACPPLAAKIMSLCRGYLSSPGATREMAAVLAGRMVTRPDMHAALSEFVNWGVESMKNATSSGSNGSAYDPKTAFLLPGVTLAFATMFKLGKRDTLESVALAVLPSAVELLSSNAASSNALVRKLAVKLVQRAGLSFLPQRVAPWRYQHGSRKTVGDNGSISPSPAVESSENEVEEDDDAPWAANEDHAEAVESSIEAMLSALGDRDTVVRWAAAKGIGRLTGRLPRELGDEVVVSVLDSFASPAASDSVWHGGCLALAELTRRGLLLPHRLSEAVPLVIKALQYDVRRGHCSVGTHVRDAAAYVCWAVARAYSRDTLGIAVATLAPALITAACFDREVNCRRAAAAAFQECVGRLGAFPHGIDILTAADYFTVSMRTAAYLQVAPYVATFPGYFEPLAWHLLQIKLQHWEQSLRELAAKALAALVPLHRPFFLEQALPFLLPAVTSPVLEVRHGAVAAIAELLPALADKASGTLVLPDELSLQIADILPNMERLRLGKGKGGEIMRGAFCRLIETTSSTGLRLSLDQLESLYGVVLENLNHPLADIQQIAAVGLSAFVDRYIDTRDTGDDQGAVISYIPAVPVVEYLLKELEPSTHSVTARRGAALALGQLPRWILQKNSAKIIHGLAYALKIESDPDLRDVETRVNSARALSKVVAAMEPAEFDLIEKSAIMPLLGALEDYTSDNRGDVGSWVREAALHALHDVLMTLGDDQIFKIESLKILSETIAAQFARQAVERIGRVRETAGGLLQGLASAFSSCTDIYRNISEALTGVSGEDFATGAALNTLSRFIILPTMRLSVLEGLAFSIGGLDAQLAEAAGEALVDSLGSLDPEDNLEDFVALGNAFVELWGRHVQSPRLGMPLLTTAELLLNRTELPVVLAYPEYKFTADVLVLARKEIEGCRDVPKLHAAAGTLCALASNGAGTVKKEALGAALGLMGNRYPKVRRYAAEQLYTTLLAWEPEELEETLLDGGSCDLENALELLSETAWDGSADVVRPARIILYTCLGLPPPQPSGKKEEREKAAVSGQQKDENASYAALIQHVQRGI